ncbi:hypothetical protein BDP27DRAFT_1453104 [Rhodocollybia butyracea]|uniref:Uncharacterized protein n=1 Tax=Rhodocollybia butyracea TaxID=206335 RepID=A0A9P5PAE6_9AGAR|nr:hypothetical protein BDP27DRAFT_1453104 [Rhodocollybia butyracea]
MPVVIAIISPLLKLIFASAIFILTLVKTAGHIKQSRESGIHSIAEVVLRDGTLFFFFNVLLRSIEAALALASIFSTSNQVSNTLTTALGVIDVYFASLTSILTNRFVFNLRAFNSIHTIQHSVKAPSNTIAPPLNALNFAENRFLGNIGAPLDLNQWNDSDVDELENEVEQGVRYIELEIPDTVNALTTLVPVIYDHDKGGQVSLVPMQREAGLG